MLVRLILMSAALSFAAVAFSGDKTCEVIGFSAYEDVKPVRDMSGLILPQRVRCATVTFKNASGRSRYATDFVLTAVFEDGSEGSAPVVAEDRFLRLAPGEQYTASACFGPDPSPIVKVECGL